MRVAHTLCLFMISCHYRSPEHIWFVMQQQNPDCLIQELQDKFAYQTQKFDQAQKNALQSCVTKDYESLAKQNVPEMKFWMKKIWYTGRRLQAASIGIRLVSSNASE